MTAAEDGDSDSRPGRIPEQPRDTGRAAAELADQIEGGVLYLVSTPIGHLGDLSPRALAALRHCDLLAAEDTRHTGRMLASFDVHRRLESYHEHNKEKATQRLIGELSEGRSVALVSDAGTPGLSDPGFVLVRAAVREGIPVVSVPGPSALLAALVASGLPTDAFTFTGFLPVKKGRRRSHLEALAGIPHTLVFYEGPHRVQSTLEQMADVFGDRWAAVCRELTKRFEEITRGRLAELARRREIKQPRGEFTIVVAGAAYDGVLLPESDA
jgi:16S rRNA (cytidine1402-2'-O)-methyltransferase